MLVLKPRSCLLPQDTSCIYNPHSQETSPPPAAGGRHLLASSSIAGPVAAAAPLSEYSHWLCGRGSAMPRADHNNVAYGPCLATTYKRLELSGLPTTDSPGFAGVVVELVVLKQDAYGQTVTTDSSSILQVFSARDGARGANDASVSFLGAIFSGCALFAIAVKPTFASVPELEGGSSRRLSEAHQDQGTASSRTAQQRPRARTQTIQGRNYCHSSAGMAHVILERR